MITTKNWTVVFNPRTASRSLAQSLRETGLNVKHGHPRPEFVMDNTQSDRIIGVVRNPMTWVWSFYYTSGKFPGQRFEDWLDENHEEVGIYWGRGLNCYRDIITEYWLFERGVPGLVRHLELRPITYHNWGYKEKPIAPYWYDGIARYFPDDCELYDQLLMEQAYE